MSGFAISELSSRTAFKAVRDLLFSFSPRSQRKQQQIPRFARNDNSRDKPSTPNSPHGTLPTQRSIKPQSFFSSFDASLKSRRYSVNLHLPQAASSAIHGDQAVLADFQDGPVPRSGDGGSGASAFDRTVDSFFAGLMVKNGAKGQQVGPGSEHHGAIDAGNVLQHRGRDVEGALVAQQIMQLVLAGNSFYHRFVIHVVEQIGLRHQRSRRLRIVEHHEQRAPAALGEVQGHGKQALRQHGVADGVLPHLVTIARIYQPPLAVEKAEDGHTIGVNFDFAVGGEDEADVSTAQSGAAVVAVSG